MTGKSVKQDIIEKRIIDQEIEGNIARASKIKQSIETKIGKGIGSEDKAFAFIIIALEKYYGKNFEDNELEEIITDGRDDKNFDVIYIHDAVIDIFDVSLKDPILTETSLLEKSFNEFVYAEPSDYSIFNPRLEKKLRELHSSTITYKINLIIIRSSLYQLSSTPELKSLEKMITDHSGEFTYLNTYDFSLRVSDSLEPIGDVAMKINPNECFISDDYTYGVFKICIIDILRLHQEKQMEGRNIFNKNIRTFLNNKNLSNEQIDTIKNTPELFHLYHNGLVISVENDVKKPVKSGKCLFNNFQIINGAQTIHNIYYEYKDNLADANLSKVYIICKIIKADGKLTKKVCETSNTQVNVKSWELVSNDLINLKLEKLINHPTSEYSFIRKGTTRSSGNKCIGLDLFYQCFYSCEFKEPGKAKNEKKYLFISGLGGYYDQIVERLEKIAPEKIVKILEIWFYIQEASNEKGFLSDKNIIRDANMHILGVFYTKKYNLTLTNFRNVLSKVKKLIKSEQGKDENITNNKIFTKSKNTFTELLKSLK